MGTPIDLIPDRAVRSLIDDRCNVWRSAEFERRRELLQWALKRIRKAERAQREGYMFRRWPRLMVVCSV